MKRVLAVIAAIALAAVGTFVVLNYARNAEARALAGEETIEVLVATEAIAQGTLAQDIAESQVEVKLIPAKLQTPGSVGNRAQLSNELKGKATSVDLVAGEQLLKSRFVDPQVAAAQSEVDVPEGLLEVTVSLDPQRALGGKLTPGETVAVLASFDPFDLQIDRTTASEEGTETEEIDKQSPNTTGIILHKILVTDVQVQQASCAHQWEARRRPKGSPTWPLRAVCWSPWPWTPPRWSGSSSPRSTAACGSPARPRTTPRQAPRCRPGSPSTARPSPSSTTSRCWRS